MVICSSLDEVRENIDKIDKQIVQLIAQRSLFVKQAAGFKKDTEDVKAPKRVEAVIEKVKKLAEEADVEPGIVEAIYRTMIGAFINMEKKELEKR
ncbi:MAG: chorismate mutase [Bacillota bacterium]|nr:chorismate mutase [Bacillota bacterium]